METEIWKDIKGYEGLYQISNMGRVKSLRLGKEMILKPKIEKRFQYRICLCVNGVEKLLFLHRLLYQAFKGELIDGMVIDHIDNDSSNNNLDNLQQITKRENSSKDSWRRRKNKLPLGVYKNTKGDRYSACIRINNKRIQIGTYDTPEEASEAYQNKLKKI